MVQLISEWYAPVFSAALGLVAITIACCAFWARRWPSVPGTIDISIYDTDLDGEGMKLFLSYSYTVGNRDYAGAHVSPPLVANVRPAKLNARLYREKMKVKVYYCPWAPGTSCLESGSLGKSLAVAAAVMGLAVFLVVRGR